MRVIITCWVLILSLWSAATGWAQDIGAYVSVDAVPNWIQETAYPEYDPADIGDRDRYYEIVDWQSKIDPHTESFFGRYAEVLLTPSGVEENSNIQISFDPTYEKVKLHYVRVRRDGAFLDRTNLEDFSIYRKETDRDKLLYNGTLEISYIVPDVRVGDMLEYAYSTHGKNPALKTHYAAGFRQQYDDVALKLSNRILIHDALPVYTKAIAKAKEPQKTQLGNYQEFGWDLTNSEPVRVDDNVPNWYFSYPTYQFTSFKNWQEIGRFFAPVYKSSGTLPPDLKTVRAQILETHTEPKDQVRAALGFVQDNIRYLGIEIGKGGYIPRPVDKVMARRFGDCKDMTVLLVALLQSMDFEAAPLLVNSSQRGGIADSIPRYNIFDHVVVHVKLGEDAYILDPTRGEQLGDLDHLQQGYFEKGVLISSDSPGLINAVVAVPDYFEDFHETFDLISAAPDVLMTSKAVYSMGSADSIKSWYESSGIDAIMESYLEFYQDRYPSVKSRGDMEISFDEQAGQATISVQYEIPDPWELDTDRDINKLSIYASEIAADIPDFDGESRKAPYAISHPSKSRQVLEIKVDENWYFEDTLKEEDVSAFYYKKQTEFADEIYKETYEYHSKKDHISVVKFSDTMGKLDEIDDVLGVALENPVNSGGLANISEAQWAVFFGALFALLAIASFVIACFFPLETAEELSEQVFHPVAMPKFIVLSLVSIGIYQYYWIFKNWRWIQKHQEEEVSPLIRSFFLNFTNFSLFPRMSETTEEGYSWFKGLSIPLALLILVTSIIANISKNGFFLFIPTLAMIFANMQVLKLNSGRDNVIARNSKFSLPTIFFIMAWSPVFILIVIGLFIS